MRQIKLLLLMMFAGLFANAQVTGVKTIPGDYADLTAAIADLNTVGVGAGGATINITAAQTAPTAGYLLGSATLNASTSAANPLVINGGNNLITAWPTGTSLGGTVALPDAVFRVAGTDYVTLNQLSIVENPLNTTTTTQMECGIMVRSLTTSDACKNLTIQNCTINLNGPNGGITTSSGPYETGISVQCVPYTQAISAVSTTAVAPLGTSGIPGDITIKGNTVQNCYNGIAVIGNATLANYSTNIIIGGEVGTEGNVITGTNINTSNITTTGYGIYQYYGNNVSIVNNSWTSSSNAYGLIYGISSFTSIGNVRVAKNTSTLTSNTLNTSSNYPLYISSGSGTGLTSSVVDSNTISNCVIGGSSLVYFTYHFASASVLTRTSYNVANNNSRASLNGTTYGYFCSASNTTAGAQHQVLNNSFTNYTATTSTTNAGSYYLLYPTGTQPATVRGNVINNIQIGGIGTGASTVYSLYNLLSTNTHTIDSNRFTNINVTNNSTTNNLYGMFCSSTTGTINLERNNASNITSSSTSTAGTVDGIYLTGASVKNVRNNIVSNLGVGTAFNADNAIKGINCVTNGTNNIYNNTIALGTAGPISSTGLNFGVSGIVWTGTPTLDLRNNIVYVDAMPAGNGMVAALRTVDAGTIGVVPTPYAATSNNNIYFAPNATNSYLYCQSGFGTGTVTNAYNLTNDPGFNSSCGSLFKAFALGRESASFTEQNLSAIGAIGDYTFAPSGSSYAESGGQTLASVTVDYNKVTRTTPPDMGSLQFGGTANDASAPVISYSPVTSSSYCTTLPALSATITDVSGVNVAAGTKPRIYFKKSTDANAWVGNTALDNGWKYTEATNAASPFNLQLDATLLQSAPVIGDVIQYFVIAQDLATVPNVGTNTAALATCPTSVALVGTSFPTGALPVINSMTITAQPPLSLVTSANPTSACLNGSSTLTVTDTAFGPQGTTTGYCLPPTSGNNATYWMANVTLTGGSTNINNTTTDAGVGGYADYYASQMCQATQGANLTFTGTGNTGYTFGWTVYVDWDRDGIFNLTNEKMINSAGYTNSITGTIAVPPTALGVYRMRVCNNYLVSTNVEPCNTATNPTYGETEDYKLSIIGLSGIPNSGFTWTGGPITGNPNKVVTATNITANTTYTVTATDGGGCTATSTVLVNLASPVLATGITGTTSYCSATPNTTLTLTTSNGSTPINSIWTGGPVVTPTVPMCISNSGFAGPYAPANWTTTQTNSNGSVNTAGAPANIVMTSSNGLSGAGTTDYSITATCAGTVSFNWSYTTTDGAGFDYPMYRVNAGAPVIFTTYSTFGSMTQSGTQTIAVAAGDVIGLQAYSTDNLFGACTITISNFAAPTTVNVVSGLTATLNPPVGTTVYTATALDACGTTSSTTVSITVDPTPTVSVAPGNANVCVGQSTAQTASGSGIAPVYTWMPGSLTGATQTLSPVASTVYTITSTDGPCSATTTLSLTSVPSPVFSSTTATPNLLCPGDVTALTTNATITTGGYGPQAYGVSSIPFAPVAGTLANAGPSGDEGTTLVTLPFTFYHYGTPYTQVYIHTNGYLMFQPYTCCTYTPPAIPNTGNSNNWCGYWSDLNASAGQITWEIFGTAPNRYFVAKYNNVPYFSASTPGYSGQTILYENGDIEVHLTNVNSAFYASAVGTENAAGTVGTAAPGINAVNVSVTNQAFRFNQLVTTPISNYAWDGGLTGNVVSPASQNTNANPSASTIYTVTATAPNGCTATSTVGVTTKPVLTGTASASPTAICLGASTTFNGTVPNVCGGNDANFAGTYAPATWTFAASAGSTGSVNTAGAPANVIISSGNNGAFGANYASYAHNVVCAGNVSFSWATSTSANNIALLSYPQYRINAGAWTNLTGYNTGAASVAQSGTQTIAAAAGDVIEIGAHTVTGDAADAYTLTLTSFSAPTLPASGFVDYWDAATGGTLLGAAPYTVTPGTAGTITYYAQYNTSTSTGCTNPVRTPISVTVNALPSVTATATPAAICLGSSSVLTGGGASTYTWDGSNPDPYTVTPTSTTSYTVTGTDGNGCTATASATVTVNTPLAVSGLSATPNTVCSNGTSTLAVTPGLAGGVYCIPTVGSAGATGDYISNFYFNLGAISNPTGDGPGDYNDYSGTLSASVVAGSTYAFDISSGPTYGQGKALFIDFNKDNDFDDAGEMVFSSPSSTSMASGTVLIPASATNGTTRMRVVAKYASTVLSTEACAHSSFGEYEDYGLVISGGVPPSPSFASVAWSPATFLNSTTLAVVTASAVTSTTTYTVTGTDANGCTSTSSVTLTVSPAPMGNTQGTAIAATLPYTTSGDNLAANCWSSEYVGANAQSSPDVFYQFTMPSCNDSVVVSLCGSGFDTYLHLLDNSGTQIAFNDDGCGASSIINFGGLTPGATYYAVVEGFSSSTGTFNLSINSYQSTSLVPAGVTASPNPACENATVTLTGTGAGVGGTYSYSGPATVTLGQFTATLAAAGIYTVTATTAAGCNGTATVNVTVNTLPTVTASVSATPICLGASTTFTGGGATSYTWTDGTNTPTDATPFTPATAGTSTYTVTGTDVNGCMNTATVALTVNALPTVTASATPTTACVGSDVTFTGGGASTYTWTNGVNTPTDATPFTMTTAGASTYTVTGTDGAGCSATSTVAVNVNPTGSFNAPTTLASACPGALGASILISSTGGSGTVTYTINPSYPAQPVSGIFNGMIGAASYTVTLSDANGCTATSAITAPALSANGGLANASVGNTSSVAGNTCQNQNQPDASSMSYYGANCDNLIASIVDNPGTPLGTINACVTVMPSVPTYNGQPYIARWYDILPQNQGGATITFYFTHDDILDFNAAAGSYPQITAPAVPSNGNTITFMCSQVPQGFLPGAPGANTTLHNVTATWNGALQRWEAPISVASFSGFYFHTGSVPLPVSITKFDGRKLNSSDMLEWTTGSEQNNAYFNLQHSTNGVDFKTIGKVNSKAANGTSQTALNYNYEHSTPSLGHNYYRLEQVDIDGKASMHAKVVDLIWGANGSTVSLYPNPTQDVLNIDLYTSKVQNTTVKVLDMSGRVVKQMQARSEAGMNSLSISLGELASGVYTVQVYDNDKLSHVGKVKKN